MPGIKPQGGAEAKREVGPGSGRAQQKPAIGNRSGCGL